MIVIMYSVEYINSLIRTYVGTIRAVRGLREKGGKLEKVRRQREKATLRELICLRSFEIELHREPEPCPTLRRKFLQRGNGERPLHGI
jgi:hypothetical protein